MTAEEKKQEKARQMRYKKPLVRDLNLETIQSELWDIQSECDDIHWACSNDDILVDALGGDEDEAYEFRMMFSDLSAECEQMVSDLEETWVPDCFDRFFVATGAGSDYGGLMGYDSYERDYMGLDGIVEEYAKDEAAKQLEHMTKRELIDAARQCFRVYQSYVSLRYRYDCLSASLAILREQNNGYLQMIRQIEEMYDRADELTDGFKYGYKDDTDLDKVLAAIPQEMWVW